MNTTYSRGTEVGPPGGVNISRCIEASISRATVTRKSSHFERGLTSPCSSRSSSPSIHFLKFSIHPRIITSISGSEFRVQGSGFRVQGSGLRGWGSTLNPELGTMNYLVNPTSQIAHPPIRYQARCPARCPATPELSLSSSRRALLRYESAFPPAAPPTADLRDSDCFEGSHSKPRLSAHLSFARRKADQLFDPQNDNTLKQQVQ